MGVRKKYRISWAKHNLELGINTCIMGILNVTPDSFSDGGCYFTVEAAVARGKKLVEDGADILDIGGESTRPFSEAVSVEEEIRRVVPVIEELASSISVPISIDTTKAEVAERAIRAGAAIINDVGSLCLDSGMADVAAENEVPVVLMHMLGTPKTMQVSPVYVNLIGEIRTFLMNAIANAEKRGLSRSKVIVDPGIGFGKTVEHNLTLIQQLHEFDSLDAPILTGPSRKSFIRQILRGRSKEDIKSDSIEVEIGTQAAISASILSGAHIVRVHDVANTRTTAKIADALANAKAD
jgi:dihydropteroate synthase